MLSKTRGRKAPFCPLAGTTAQTHLKQFEKFIPKITQTESFQLRALQLIFNKGALYQLQILKSV